MSKVWFITGATRGIGAEIAKAALAAGDKVVATGRAVAALTQVLGKSANLLAIALDVVVEAQAIAAVGTAVDRFGCIDVLVNNAGFAVLGALEETSDDEVRKQFDTNVFGLLNVTRSALPVLRKQGRGHIMNISSLAGFYGDAGASSYCGSKFAVEGITECLAKELRPLGIHVTIIEPGYFRTEFLNSNSVVYANRIIDDYAPTAGATRLATISVNGKQANDPKRLAAAMLVMAETKMPPVRFTAGSDAVSLFEEMLVNRKADVEKWRDLSNSMAHSD